MKQIKINTPDDLTRENIKTIRKELNDMKNDILSQRFANEDKPLMRFDNIEECLKYHNAIPFDEYVKKIKAKYARYF